MFVPLFQIAASANATLESVVDEMEELCITFAFEIERTNDTMGTDEDPLLIVENIMLNVCPSQCSGHGECQAGRCTCHEGEIVYCSAKRYEYKIVNHCKSIFS